MVGSDENTRLVNILERIAVGALFLVVTWIWSNQGKMEDRMYELKSQSFTVDSARILEDRLSKNIDAVRSDINNQVNGLRNEVNSKLDLLIKMQSEKTVK